MLDVLVNNFVGFLLVFVRVLALFVAAPILGDRSIPMLLRVLFSLFLALILVMITKVNIAIGDVNLWFIVMAALKEMVTGLMIGFFMHLIFWGISFAGSIMGFNLGLSLAELISPIEDISGDVISFSIYLFGMLIFLLLDGPEFLVRSLYYSFKVIPLSGINLTKEVETSLLRRSAEVFVIAVKIASPIMVTFFLLDISEGIMSKIIPQMQVFFVLYPLRLGVGILMVSVSIVFFFFVIKNLLVIHEENLLNLIKAMS